MSRFDIGMLLLIALVCLGAGSCTFLITRDAQKRHRAKLLEEGREEVRKEAIQAGAATWGSDTNGNLVLVWVTEKGEE